MPLCSERIARCQPGCIQAVLDNPPASDRCSFALPLKRKVYDIALSIDIASSQLRLVDLDRLKQKVTQFLSIVSGDAYGGE